MIRSYVYANAQPLAMHTGPASAPRYFYLHDRLGSVRILMDQTAATKNTYTYNPFGEDIASECSYPGDTGYVDNNFKFTGQWHDPETGQYYLRARQYDPHIMRFTGRDPVKGKFQAPLTLHRYLYCSNDPSNRIDPKGEFSLALAGKIAGGLINMTVVYAEVINQMTYSVSPDNDKFFAMAMQTWSLGFILGMEGLVEGPGNSLAAIRSIILGLATGGFVDGTYGNYEMGSQASKWLMSSGGYAVFQACMLGFQYTSGISYEEMEEFNDWNTR